LALPEEGTDASRESLHAPRARDFAIEVCGQPPDPRDRPAGGAASSTVRAALERFQAASLTWPLPEQVSDSELEAALYTNIGSKQGHRRHVEPDWFSHFSRKARWKLSRIGAKA
jgi:hypothetical protein